MVQDLVHNLCESLVENIDGVADVGKKTPPTPITYLTQWLIVGNSEVHTDPYLASWKVSGNSVVDNNTILSCGDLGQDGKYHVKISNGATIYDIPLTEPLRKINDVADKIEFVNGVATVTRNLTSIDLGSYSSYTRTGVRDYNNKYGITGMRLNGKVYPQAKYPSNSSEIPANMITTLWTTATRNNTYIPKVSKAISMSENGTVVFYDEDYDNYNSISDFNALMQELHPELIYELATPTTEVIQVSPFPVSPTDTYTSANVTPYSAFEYKKNVEIWSCGEYNPMDGKWHILVQPQGGSIADIVLDEPLRKVNDVADTIEFPSDTEGKALVTRNLASVDMGTLGYSKKVGDADIRIGYIPNKKNTRECAGLIEGAIQKPSINTKKPASDYLMDKEWCWAGTDTSYYAYIKIMQYKDYDRREIASAMTGKEFIYELATPTTELVDAPQIAEAESYSMIISQGAKAVSWSSFETE